MRLESIFFFSFGSGQRVSPLRIGIARGLLSSAFFSTVKCCSESKLIYYLVVIETGSVWTMIDLFLTEISTVARYAHTCSLESEHGCLITINKVCAHYSSLDDFPIVYCVIRSVLFQKCSLNMSIYLGIYICTHEVACTLSEQWSEWS